jgi:hypothetical protein
LTLQRLRDSSEIDNGGLRDPQSGDAPSVCDMISDVSPSDALESREPIRKASGHQDLEPGKLLAGHGHDKLAEPPYLYVVI